MSLRVPLNYCIDHVWEKCPDNTNAVERKNRDAKDNVPVPVRQGLIIFTNWTNHTVLSTLQQKKDVAFHTQVGVVNPEQKQLKLDVSSGVCKANQIQFLTNPATSKKVN